MGAMPAPRSPARKNAVPTAKGGAAPPFPGNDSSSSPSFSADGRYVAFMSQASNLVPDDTNGVFDIFLLDRNDGSIRRVSTNEFGGQADGQSWVPSLSPDGSEIFDLSRGQPRVHIVQQPLPVVHGPSATWFRGKRGHLAFAQVTPERAQ